MSNSVIFDLDDTLYKEIDYVKSGFMAVSSFISDETKIITQDLYDMLISNYSLDKNTFLKLINFYNLNISLEDIVDCYRSHLPSINLDINTKKVLESLKNKNQLKGLLTDGRSIQQRNKIKALNLDIYFNDIVISQEFGSGKLSVENYLHFSGRNDSNYFYIGDNTEKDFFWANKLGWKTICLKDNGQNIHRQNFELASEYLPDHIVNNILEITSIINEK